MRIPQSIENWLYRVANPVVKALLRSPLHRIASGSLALLHFRGRKSGREFVTPLSYVRENGTVCFLSAHSTRWWMNLREEGTPVSIEIARETLTGRARLWDGDSVALRERVRRFLSARPRDAKLYGIKLDERRRPVEESLAKAAPELIFVEVALD
ncbi:MAG: nitroreductase/quinone reductase family protein [Candidatus Binatia bacterium]